MRNQLVIIGIIALLVCVGLSGCYSTPLTKGPSENNSNNASATVLAANVGETVKGKDLEVTVKSDEKVESYNWTGGGTGLKYVTHADSGKIFVIINVKFKQIGSGSEYVYAGDFWIVDSQNNKYDYDGIGTYSITDGLGATTLYQNLQVEGKVLFQIPVNLSGIKLQYNFASFWDEPKLVEWNL
jgi:hypothetical protein